MNVGKKKIFFLQQVYYLDVVNSYRAASILLVDRIDCN